jgi:hypothetical protein
MPPAAPPGRRRGRCASGRIDIPLPGQNIAQPSSNVKKIVSAGGALLPAGGRRVFDFSGPPQCPAPVAHSQMEPSKHTLSRNPFAREHGATQHIRNDSIVIEPDVIGRQHRSPQSNQRVAAKE